MKLEQNINIHNRFDITVRDIVTGESKEYRSFNIVLNQMWDFIMDNSFNYFAAIHFGSGTGTPTPERTSLFTPISAKTASDVEVVKSLPVSRWKRKIELAPEEHVGATIREVGIGRGTTSTHLLTHAMLRDAEGNPISITKTDTMVVTIIATVFITFSSANGIKINETTNSQLLGFLVGRTASLAGNFSLTRMGKSYTALGSTANVVWTPDAANKRLKTNTVRFGTATANGHAQGICFGSLMVADLSDPAVFAGQAYAGVAVGTGDGVKTKFTIPSFNIKSGTLVTKVDGATVAVTENLFRQFNGLIMSGNHFDSGAEAVVSKNGKVAAWGCRNHPYAYVYDLENMVYRPLTIATSGTYCYNIAISDDGEYLLVATDSRGFVLRWDGVAYKEITTGNPGVGAVGYNCTGINHDGTKLFILQPTGGSTQSHIYDLVSGVWTRRPNLPNFTASNAKLVLTEDFNKAAYIMPGTTVLRFAKWNGTSWTELPSISLTDIYNDLCIRGDKLVMGQNASFRIYDISTDTATLLETVPHSLAGGIVLVSASYDCTVIAGSKSTGSPVIMSKKDGAWANIASGQTVNKKPAVNGNAEVAVSADYNNHYMYDIRPRSTEITFVSPPAIGAAITADYTVAGIHKTSNYVVDVDMTIQFGEG